VLELFDNFANFFRIFMSRGVKKVAILQSNYIPWKGYFDLINMVDEFILYDDMQYTKNDWRNRNKIKTPEGTIWLTIPVRSNYQQKIKDTCVSYPGWNRKHWKSIGQCYSKAKCFHAYRELFEDLYMGADEKLLSRINYRFLTAICAELGIDTRISWSMDYSLTEVKTERLVNLCKQAGATEYLSGPSAKGYMDEELFRKEDIKLSWMEYSGYPEYGQLYPPFDHYVSVIDLILNEGADAPKYMRSFSR